MYVCTSSGTSIIQENYACTYTYCLVQYLTVSHSREVASQERDQTDKISVSYRVHEEGREWSSVYLWVNAASQALAQFGCRPFHENTTNVILLLKTDRTMHRLVNINQQCRDSKLVIVKRKLLTDFELNSCAVLQTLQQTAFERFER